MKRSISFIMLLLILVVLTACNSGEKSEIDVGTIDGISITVDADTVTSTGFDYVISNQTDEVAGYGRQYAIERRSKSEWYSIPYVIDENDVAWTLELLIISPYSEASESVDFEYLYGELKPGDYRIIKKIGDTYIAGEFTIE